MTEMPSFIPFQGIYHLEWAVFALKQLHCVKYCLKYDHFSITVMDISGSEIVTIIYSWYAMQHQK